MRQGRIGVAVLAALALAGCAVRLGGPSPIERDAASLYLPADASPAATAQLILERDIEFAIVSAPRDSAWFADLATRSNRMTTRPGRLNGRTYAFLSPMKALGDTTLTLPVSGGGQVRIHDALYQVDKNRRIDLLAVRLDSMVSLQKSLETLLTYVATDVGATVSVLLAIEPPTPELSDSVSIIMRALYGDLWECAQSNGGDQSGTAELPVRVFYGPAVRMRCLSAERLEPGKLIGHFELLR